jgi:hypothetical protein
VAAGSYVGQERLQILVRVPDVEGEGLQVIDRLNRSQALFTGELLEGGTARPGLLTMGSRWFSHVTSSTSGLQVVDASEAVGHITGLLPGRRPGGL